MGKEGQPKTLMAQGLILIEPCREVRTQLMYGEQGRG